MESLEEIGNKLGIFLDNVKPRFDMCTCAYISMEVYIEASYPKEIELWIDL